MNKKYDVFISYSRKDAEIADRICSILQSNGITYFIDRQGIGGGMEFPVVLAQAIRNSELFLFLASKNSYSSKFTINEITYAFNKKERNQILPYIIDGSSLPEDLEFVFAGINWRTIQQHPINSVLISDVKRLLGQCTNNTGSKDRTDEHIQQSAKLNNDNNEPTLESFYTFVDNYRMYGFKNEETGKVVIPCKWRNCGEFSEGLAMVMDDKRRWGFIDKTGLLVIPCMWEKARSFFDGKAKVQTPTGKWLRIDKKGIIIDS